LGIGYVEQKLDSNKNNDYILVFEADESEINNNVIFRYTESAYYTSNKLNASYKKVALKLQSLDEKTVMGKIKINEKMWLGASTIKDRTLSINGVTLDNSFTYEINSCFGGTCNKVNQTVKANIYSDTPTTLLRLLTSYEVDKSVTNNEIKNVQDLITRFGKIKYTIGNKQTGYAVVNRLPENYEGNYIIMEVPAAISQASNLELWLTIRNKQYVYVLK
jgi:hypothetical protein